MMSTTLGAAGAKPWAERMAVIALFIANGFGTGAWATTIPSIKAQFALSDGTLSLVLFAMTLGGVIGMPLAGFLGQRLGSATACKITALWCAVGMVLPTLAPSYGTLAFACFAFGGGISSMDVCMNVQASDIEQRWGGAIMSFFHACWSIGALSGAAFGALVFAQGIDAHWILWGAALAATILIAAAFPALINSKAARSGQMLSLPGWAALPLCLSVLLAMLCEHAVTDWSGVYLRVVVLSPPVAAASGYVFFAGSMLIGRLFGDAIVHRFGRGAVVRLGGAMAAAGLLLVALVPAQIPCLIGLTVAGFGIANVVPSLFSAASRLGSSPSAGIAMAATAGYTGFLAGPPIMGGIATTIGLQGSMMFIAAGALAISLMSGRLPATDAQTAKA
jgi:MFS family permease